MKKIDNLFVVIGILIFWCAALSCNKRQRVDPTQLLDGLARNLTTDSFDYYYNLLTQTKLEKEFSRRQVYLLGKHLLLNEKAERADSVISKLIKEGCPEGSSYAIKAITLKKNWYADTSIFNKIKHFEKYYKEKKINSCLVELYTLKGYCLSNQGETEASDQAFNTADTCQKKYGNTKSGLFYYFNRGKAYRFQGKNLLAKKYFKKKLDLALRKGTQREINRSKLAVASIQIALNEQQEAIQACLELLSYYEKNDTNSTQLPHVLNGLAVIYQRLNDYKKAKTYFFKMLQVLNRASNRYNSKGGCLYNISRNYYFLKKSDSAIIYAHKALEIFTKDKKIFYSILCENHLATIYLDSKKYKLAKKYYLDALSHKIDIDGTMQQMDSYSGLGRLLLEEHQDVKGIEYINLAINMAKKEAAIAFLVENYGTLRDYYASINDFRNAHLVTEKRIMYKDSLQVIHNLEALNTEKIKFEKEKENYENEFILKNIKSEQAMKNRTAQGKMLILIVVALLLLSMAFFYRKTFLQKKESELVIKYKNAKLNSLIGELEESNSNLSNFAQVAAHDIRSPLTSIKLFTYQLLYDKDELSTTLRNQFFNQISESTDKMSDMISGLLTLSELKQEIKFKTINLNNILLDLKNQLAMEFNNIEGALEIEPNLPNVKATESLIRVVFQNLLNNAIKYKRQDIPLHISITLNKEKSTPSVCIIDVTDNGIGIEESFIQKIFDIYNKKSTDKDSFGIGLSTCKKIITKLGGKISVSSTPNVGSIFSISLQLT